MRIERAVTDKATLGKSKKLMAKFQGPYRIVKILPNDRYLVEDTPITRKENRRYENVVAIDKIHPRLSFNDPISDDNDNDSDSDGDQEIEKATRRRIKTTLTKQSTNRNRLTNHMTLH